MWDIKTIIKDYFKTKTFQEFINNRYKDNYERTCPLNVFKIIGTDNALFYLDDLVPSIEGAYADYKIEDLKPTDIVLDIGACIGGFSLNVCKKVKHVYAVEPIVTDRLNKNIQLNNVKNITVLEYALGYNNSIPYSNTNYFLSKYNKGKKIECKTLSEIIDLCGGHVDYLKLDSEGSEWYIKPEELKNINIVEAEIHSFRGMPKLNTFDKILTDAGFKFKKEILDKEAMLIHAKK